MADPADSVVEGFGWREGLMTTFVCQYPHSSCCQPLGKGVKRPQAGSERGEGDCFQSDTVMKEIEGGRKDEEVTSNICQAADGRSFKTMGWYGVTNLLNGVVRQCELVAVRVEQLRFGLLGVECVGRAER